MQARVLVVVSIVALALLGGALWMLQQSSATNQATDQLVVYCAAGIRAPLEDTVAAYEKYWQEKHGRPIRIEVEYGGSGTLLSKLKVAERGDLFLAGDDSYIQLGREQGLIDEELKLASMKPVIAVAQNRLASLQPQSVQEIRDMEGPIIRFSKPLYQNLKAIKLFLFQRMYRAPSVVIERKRVTEMLNGLFPLFLNDPSKMPEHWFTAAEAAGDETGRARVVLDYVAGMTDRFAIQEAQRLLG